MNQMFKHFDELVEISEFVSLQDLLAHGFDPAQPDEDGIYALEPVCETLKLDLASELIKAGADVNTRGSTGFTPLFSAIECSHHDPKKAVKLVELLLDSGADIEGRGEWDKTPFLKSCTRGIIELTQLLVSRGCDIHATAAELGGTMGACEYADMPSISREFRQYVRGLFHS
jgi:ankyrin repeat protein